MLSFSEEEEKDSDQEKEQCIEMGDGQREPEPSQAWKPRVYRHKPTEHVRKWPQNVSSKVSGAMVRLRPGRWWQSVQLDSSLRSVTKCCAM